MLSVSKHAPIFFNNLFTLVVRRHVHEISFDRRNSGKSRVKTFSITLGFATNKIIPDDSLAEGTIYILNNVPKSASTLPKALMLSAD